MKQFSREHIGRVVRDFANSRLADAWHLFGPDIRRAILDSLVMKEIRIADSVNPAFSVTAAELMAFRQALEETLAAGIQRHNKAMRVAFEVNES